MRIFLVAGALALCLGGCMPAVVLATGGLVAATVDAYCASTTDPAKQAVRDRVSGGTPVIACADVTP